MTDGKSPEAAAYGVIKFIAWVLYIILGFACVVLAFAFALLIFGADSSAGFAHFIYGQAARFMDPFRGMIEPLELDNGGLVSWSSLFAIAAYLVLISIVSAVNAWARRRAYRARKAAETAASQPAETATVTAGTPQAAPTSASAQAPPASPESPPSQPEASE